MIALLSSIIENSSPEQIKCINLEEVEGRLSWGKIGRFDEEELLEELEIELEQMVADGKLTEAQLKAFEELIESRKVVVEEKIKLLNPRAIELLHQKVEILKRKHKKRLFE